MIKRSYLDHAASSPLRKEVMSAMFDTLALDGNASSVHQEGRKAKQLLERARRDISSALGVTPERLVFTSGATEANETVANQAQGQLLCSAIEHPSILFHGNNHVRVGSDGLIDLTDLKTKLVEDRPKIVSVMAVNNEIGTIQPLTEIIEIVRNAGSLIHFDAVQALGRIDLSKLDVDFISLSAHKIGGPKGIGALVVPEGEEFNPLISGGGQEKRRRSGTENVAGAVGFSQAFRSIGDDERIAIQDLRDQFEQGLAQVCSSYSIVAAHSPRASHISAVQIDGKRAETLVMQLDLAGIAISAGSACSSGKVQPSHVLQSMGLDDAKVESTIRVSFGWSNNQNDVARLLSALSQV